MGRTIMPLNIIDESGVGFGSPHIGASQIQNPIENLNPTLPIKATKTIEEINETTKPTTEELADREQKEIWDREDAIRHETQEREDNINQRMVADMRKAGINPNLQSGASAVGGGITSGTAKNLARIENEKERALKKAMQEIELNWSGTQKDLDRITSIINATIRGIL